MVSEISSARLRYFSALSNAAMSCPAHETQSECHLLYHVCGGPYLKEVASHVEGGSKFGGSGVRVLVLGESRHELVLHVRVLGRLLPELVQIEPVFLRRQQLEHLQVLTEQDMHMQ
jgi:hypothetical protein